MGIRKQFSNEFKAKVAMEALKGLKTMSELASEYGVHPTQIATWRSQLKEHAAEIVMGMKDQVAPVPDQGLAVGLDGLPGLPGGLVG